LLLTPDTFVRTALPGMKNASAVVHIGPALGAAFAEYTAELEPQGELAPAAAQRFLYVMEGAIVLEAGQKRHDLGMRAPTGRPAFAQNVTMMALCIEVARGLSTGRIHPIASSPSRECSCPRSAGNDLGATGRTKSPQFGIRKIDP